MHGNLGTDGGGLEKIFGDYSPQPPSPPLAPSLTQDKIVLMMTIWLLLSGLFFEIKCSIQTTIKLLKDEKNFKDKTSQVK